jgi:hypothetical protein
MNPRPRLSTLEHPVVLALLVVAVTLLAVFAAAIWLVSNIPWSRIGDPANVAWVANDSASAVVVTADGTNSSLIPAHSSGAIYGLQLRVFDADCSLLGTAETDGNSLLVTIDAAGQVVPEAGAAASLPPDEWARSSASPGVWCLSSSATP